MSRNVCRAEADHISHSGLKLASEDTWSSALVTTTNAVIRAENASIKEHALNTASLALETPVIRETTTNTFKGTRNRELSYIIRVSAFFLQ